MVSSQKTSQKTPTKLITTVSPRATEARAEESAPRQPDHDTSGSPSCEGDGLVSMPHRTAMIAQAAYFRSEQRGFVPGHELEDWVVAEQEVDRLLREGRAE